MPPATTAKASSWGRRWMRAASVHAPVENWPAGEAGEGDGEQRKNVGDGDQRGGDEHGARVVALRVFDFLRDGGGVVPAHVVPEGDGDGAGEIGRRRMRSCEKARPGAVTRCQLSRGRR